MKKHFPAFHKRLHAWYASHGRKDLPWRTTRDPYAIWISEVMLQQTQVKTVLERYYHPFLTRFPTVATLAGASRDEVLSAWQGLGYYNRAINLHEAAQRIQRGNNSYFPNPESRILPPSIIETLMSLPGVGRNTAHAVSAFAYRLPVAVMEANVKRVICRIFALENPGDNELWERAHQLLDTDDPFDYNQAMMDIGSLVCTKHAPRCAQCPANSLCKGKTSPQSYPAAKSKKAVPVRPKRIVVFHDQEGRVFATPRSSRLLQGLYGFAEVDADEETLRFQGRDYALAKHTPIGHIRQQYSHFTLEADILLVGVERNGGNEWYAWEALGKLPFSMAEQKILALLAAQPAIFPKEKRPVKNMRAR